MSFCHVVYGCLGMLRSKLQNSVGINTKNGRLTDFALNSLLVLDGSLWMLLQLAPSFCLHRSSILALNEE